MAPKKTKVEKLIEKGDSCVHKGKHKKALKYFMEAKELEPDNTELYDRLIKAHEAAAGDEWNEKDFIQSVSWAMEKQEIIHPGMKRMRDKTSPEWKEVSELIAALLAAQDVEGEEAAIDEIFKHEKKALGPLIDFILVLKHGSARQETGEVPPPPNE